MARQRVLYSPQFQPLLTEEQQKDLVGEKLPAAALAAAIPVGLLMRKFPGRDQAKNLVEAVALGTAAAGGSYLGIKIIKNVALRQRQKKALDLTPLKPGEVLQMGPNGKRGVWRTMGSRHIFIEVNPRESVPQAIKRTQGD